MGISNGKSVLARTLGTKITRKIMHGMLFGKNTAMVELKYTKITEMWPQNITRIV